MVLAVIYLTASLASSLSVLTCDHHHHHFVGCSSCDDECACNDELQFKSLCCDHHHPTLGDNYTAYISDSHRGDWRAVASQLMLLMPAVMLAIVGELPLDSVVCTTSYGDEYEPLRAAFISAESLRAPPVLA